MHAAAASAAADSRGLSTALPAAKTSQLLRETVPVRWVFVEFMEADLEGCLHCSYQASVPGFVKAGFSTAEAEELMRRSVRLAVKTRDDFWAEHQQAQAASHQGDYGPLERARFVQPLQACACAVLHAAAFRKADYV